MFRNKKRCRNLSPSPHPSYHGRRCVRDADHDGMCQVKIGPYRHYWNQAFYERLGRALSKSE